MAEILSEIFERRLSLDGGGSVPEDTRWDAAMTLWQSMADRLDEIAANTRKGVRTVKDNTSTPAHYGRGKTSSSDTEKTALKRPAAEEKDNRKIARTGRNSPVPATSQKERIEAAAQEGVVRLSNRVNVSPPPPSALNQTISVSAAQAKATQLPVSRGATETPKIPAPVVNISDSSAKEQNNSAPAKSKSAESLEKHREASLAKEQGKSLAQTLKENLKNWDGSIIDQHSGDAADAAGLAAGGPVYAALKEAAQAIGDRADDENSLTGAIRKTIEDKTGITAAKAKVEGVKESARDRILEWAGGDMSAQEKKGRRDKNGRFLRKEPVTKEQLELAEKSVAIAEKEAKEAEKRHKELIRAVRSSESGGTLQDAIGNKLGNWGNRPGSTGKAPVPAKGGRFARMKSGIGRFARAGGKFTLGAGSIGAGLLTGGGVTGAVLDTVAGLGASAAHTPPIVPPTAPTAMEAATQKTASTAVSKVGGEIAEKGAVKGTGKIGMKAVANAAKAVPVVGQVLAAGMAVADGVSGWNDAEMHKEAFGLAEGQEASTGQKAASAVANVLDMGGLLTGGASLLGFDLDTADIAKGLFGFFGGDDAEERPADTDTVTATEELPEMVKSNLAIFDGNHEEQKSPASDAAEDAAQADMPPAIAWETDDTTSSLFESLSESITDLKDAIEEGVEADEAEGGLMPQVTGLFSGISSWFNRGGSGKVKEIPGARAQAEAISGQGLGALSAKYESGKRGSAAVGYDRTGGTSFGKYQIASKTGTMDKFLDWAEKNGGVEGREVAARMRSAGPLDSGKNGQAANEWKALASEGKLGTLEHDFIKATHFDPAFAGIKDDGLRKRIEGSKALQDVLWSTSVQHGAGGAQKLINRTYKEGMSDEDFVRALYADRGTQFSSSTAQVQASVRNRFANEAEVAVAMLAEEKKAVPVQADTAIAEAKPAPATSAEAAPASPAATPGAMAAGSTTVAAHSVEAAPKPAPIAVESVGQIAPPTGHEKPAMETAGMEKLLKEILAAIVQGGNLQKNTPGECNGPPSIGMDFDDAAARDFANA